MEERPVDKPAHLPAVPNEAKGVKVAAKVEGVAAVAAGAARAAEVGGAADHRGAFPLRLHQVDFAVLPPQSVGVRCGQHPNGRPQLATSGEAGANLEFSPYPGLFADQSAAGEVVAVVLLRAGFDGEQAVGDADIAPCSVRLQLTVEGLVQVVLPQVLIQAVAGEFVLPYQRPPAAHHHHQGWRQKKCKYEYSWQHVSFVVYSFEEKVSHKIQSFISCSCCCCCC